MATEPKTIAEVWVNQTATAVKPAAQASFRNGEDLGQVAISRSTTAASTSPLYCLSSALKLMSLSANAKKAVPNTAGSPHPSRQLSRANNGSAINPHSSG